MKTLAMVLAVACAIALPAFGATHGEEAGPAPAGVENRADWAHFFSEAGATGTIAVRDERTHTTMAYDPTRAAKRYVAASTFKIPHALFALDAGVIRDEFQVFPWDSTKREFASWNADQDLRSSMRNSTVWVYQWIARTLGEERETRYLRRTGYGNADASGGVEDFWLDGPLQISALEQLAFLHRLQRNALPFRVEHQRLVKDILIVQAGRDWILRAKTGWARTLSPQVGWYVGWVDLPDGTVFFALNIDMPHGLEDAPKREAIARGVLRSLGALPAD